MLIALYTSRLLLKALGIDDFGIYNVVGGVVMLFSFINSTLAVSSQRFLNYEMGKGNYTGINEVFCTSVNIQLLIAIIIFIMGEASGLYLLYHYLSIPQERMFAAFWVLQFSILTLIVNILSVPYNAFIIAKEDMKSFAYIDILASVLKLLAVLAIITFVGDRLIFYALLILLVQIIIRFIYSFYCNHKYAEVKYHFCRNDKLMKEMLSFSSWTSLSGITSLLNNYGIGILYNMFYGVAVNAAIGISNQIHAAVWKLLGNFTNSFNPQITKNYASGDWNRVKQLHFTGAKLSFFLMSLLSVPIILNTKHLLGLWLIDVPPYTDVFTQIILCIALISSLTSTSNTLVRSTGKIKSYELILNGIIVFFFFLSFICFRLHFPLYVPYLMLLFSSVTLSFFEGYRSCKCIGISCRRYFYSVHFRMLLSFFIGLSVVSFFPLETEGIIYLLVRLLYAVIVIALCEYLIGFNNRERNFLKQTVSKIWHKFF